MEKRAHFRESHRTDLENSIYITTAHQKSASSAFASNKYLQHLLIISIVILWLHNIIINKIHKHCKSIEKTK